MAGGSAGGSSGPGSWSSLPDIPGGRYYPAATVALDGRIFVFGGQTSASGYLDSTEVYIPPTNTWQVGPNTPVPISGATAITLPDAGIVLTGGINGNGFVPSSYAFNVFTGQWATLPAPAAPRTVHGSALISPTQWFVAGGTGFLASAERYDATTMMWSPLPALPAGLSSPLAASDSAGRLYVFGGYTRSPLVPQDNLYQLAPGATAWTMLAPIPLARGRVFGNGTDRQGRFYIAGGATSITPAPQDIVDNVDRFDPSTGQWESLTPMPTPRCNHAMTFDAQGRIYVIAGNTPTGLTGSVDVFTP